MDKIVISKRFTEQYGKYEKLGQNIVQALEIFLKENDIGFLSVYFRVKEKASFLEKIERKSYDDPFDQIEDICGVRIICYYQSDVQKISEIIEREFDILENQDKEDLLNADQFGYRSTHFIVRIKRKWLQAPNYRGLENLKTEIQVRTVLMHAWAEIEHKLAYKKEVHIPKEFKRKLYRISAKLEESDEQFEELRNKIFQYREEVKEIAESENPIQKSKKLDLNLDSLQAFLDANFPDRKKDIKDTAVLVDSFNSYKVSFSDFVESYNKVKSYLERIEEDYFNKESERRGIWAQTGVARHIMDLTNDKWRETRGLPQNVREFYSKWHKIISEEARGVH